MPGSRAGDTEYVARTYRYHAPTSVQVPVFEEIRDTAGRMAQLLIRSCPHVAELEVALERLEEVVMHANAAVARYGVNVDALPSGGK